MYHYSPSQVRKIRACERVWYFDKVLGVERPETEAMRAGRAIHAELEAWVRSGIVPSIPAAREASRTVPRDPALVPELAVAEILSERVALIGAIDLLDLRDPTHPIVTDYKTLGDWRYMLAPYALALDVQMCSYAYAVLEQLPSADACTIRHLYIKRTGVRAVPPRLVQTVISRAHVARQRIAALKTMRRGDALRVLPALENVPATGDPDECVRYAGCWYWERCKPVKHSILPPDSARRPEGAEYATIDTVSPEVRATLLKTQKDRAEYEATAAEFRATIARLTSAHVQK